MGQMVKSLPAMLETRLLSLGWEDPLEEGMQPTPVFLPGKSPWTDVAKTQTWLRDYAQEWEKKLLQEEAIALSRCLFFF